MAFETTRPTFLMRLRGRSDQPSWHEFHERYGELLFRYARARGASAADAEDVVQEVEMYLFKAMERFEYDAAKGRFRSYLRAAVVHAMSRRASRDARQASALDPFTLELLAPPETDGSDEKWEREWRLHRLRCVMCSLAAEFEQVTLEAFHMHVLANRPVEETAEHLGISRASVYQAKSRVLRKIKERMEQLDADGDE